MIIISGSESYKIDIDEQEKKETFKIFKKLGIPPEEAVKMFFREVRRTKSIPPPIAHIPNKETVNKLKTNTYSEPFDKAIDLFDHIRKNNP